MLRAHWVALTGITLAMLVFAPSSSARAEGEEGGGATVTQSSGGKVIGRLPLAQGEGSRHSSETTKSHRRTSQPKKGSAKTASVKLVSLSQTIMCREAKDARLNCPATQPTSRRRSEPARARVDVAAIARTLITRIQLPDPTPQIGPDPKVNEWNMAAVGYPLWLWTTGPATITDRVRAHGVTFTLQAHWTSTRFTMGDGHSVLCTRTQPYTPATKPGSRAPHCGYTYQQASLPQGNYTVSATTNWQIRWSAMSTSGTMPASHTGTRELPVGELNALIVK